jgi:hypothetical protein
LHGNEPAEQLTSRHFATRDVKTSFKGEVMKRIAIRVMSVTLAIAGCLVTATDAGAFHGHHRRGYGGGGCGGSGYGGYSYGGPVYGGYAYRGWSYGGGYATYPYRPVYGGYSYGQTWNGYSGGYGVPAYSSPTPLAGAAVDSNVLPPAGTPNALGDADRNARADLRGDALPPGSITPLQTTEPGAAPAAPVGNLGTPNADAAGIPGTPADASLRAAPPVTPGTR